MFLFGEALLLDFFYLFIFMLFIDYLCVLHFRSAIASSGFSLGFQSQIFQVKKNTVYVFPYLYTCVAGDE